MSEKAEVREFCEQAVWVDKLEQELADLKDQVKEKRAELKEALKQYVSLGLQEKGGAE